MFVDFMYLLRSYGLKVSSHEWQTLLEALERGHAAESLHRFYYLARAVCCRSEMDYDLFDRCFAEFFKDLPGAAELPEALQKWLQNPIAARELTAAEKAALKTLELDELRELFEQRMREQKERHDGGQHWVGTGGRSPFGHGGYHPSGVRVGGSSGQGSAVQIASQRLFQNFRRDVIIDTRQIGIALRKLRHWGREGHPSELDLDGSIEATAKNAGDIALVFRPERRNNLKLLLLMDVGGSMTYHTRICEQLFSAAHQSVHFKEFRHYYFHNCPYDFMFSDIEQQTRVKTRDILRELDSSWLLLFVGDAAMAPSELTAVGGAIDYFQHNEEPGLVWIQRLHQHFPCSVWLNPEPPAYWQRPSNQLVRTVMPAMYPLSLEGLDASIEALKKMQQRRG